MCSLLVIVLVILLLFSTILGISDAKLRKYVVLRLVIALLIQLLFFILYRLELYSIGREVYYSDAEIYWKHTLSYLSGNIYYAYNDAYIWICYIIQKTSPFIWVGWNNIYNILIVDLSIILCANIIYRENEKQLLNKKKGSKCDIKEHTNLKQFLNWTVFNPLITYSLMRNLKDATYLFLICIIIYVFYLIQYSQRRRIGWISYFIFLFFMTIVLYRIRPWAFVTSLIAIWCVLDTLKIRGFTKIVVVIVILLSINILMLNNAQFSRIYSSTKLWVPIVFDSYQKQSFMDKILSLPRLFVGPGPFRSILGKQYFMFYTNIGNFMSFVGSIIWWIQFVFMISQVLEGNIKNLTVFAKYMFLNLLFYILIYSMAYRGSTELRFRGVLYILVSALFFSISCFRIERKLLPIISILLLTVTISALIFG